METYATYDSYLRSPEWRRLRRACFVRDGFACRLCNNARGLEAHHRLYPPGGWGTESIDDLTTLCARCHAHHHTDWMREDAEWQDYLSAIRRVAVAERSRTATVEKVATVAKSVSLPPKYLWTRQGGLPSDTVAVEFIADAGHHRAGEKTLLPTEVATAFVESIKLLTDEAALVVWSQIECM
jgi:hypothetical protein